MLTSLTLTRESTPKSIIILFIRKFIQPGTPNFGGLWEAGVKSTKSYRPTNIIKEKIRERACSLLLHVDKISITFDMKFADTMD